MGPEGLIAVWTYCSDTWFLVLCGNYAHILRLMFWDVFTEVENVMVLNSMDYLSQWDLTRWNNPGRQLLVRADDSPLQFSGPRLGRGGCKAPPNPGALGSPTARRWNYIKSDHLSSIYCAWFLSLSVRLGSPSPMYNNTDRNTPHRVVQDPKKGPWPLTPMETPLCSPERAAAMLLYHWEPTWAAFPSKVPFPNPHCSQLRPFQSHVSLCRDKEAELAGLERLLRLKSK